MRQSLGITSKTDSQVGLLLENFKADPYPGKEVKDQFAQLLNTSRKKIGKWFDNMRQKKSKEGFQEKSV